MKSRLILLGAVVTLWAAAPLAAQHPVSLQDVMNLKSPGSVAMSPDGQWVLYTVRGWTPASAGQKKPVKEESRSHVWLVSASDPSGAGAPRQITFGDKGESAPAWSPDGKYVSFIANRPDPDDPAAKPSGQIYVMRADGGEAHAVTSGEGGASSYAWSPDGTRIAFLRVPPLSDAAQAAEKRGDDVAEYEGDFRLARLWTVNLANGKETDWTTGDDFTIKGSPVWSPDGRQLVFAASPTTLLRDNRTNLFLLTLASKQVRRLTQGLSASSSPAWSPDGRSIAYLFDPDAYKALGDGIPFQDSHNSHLMLLDMATGQSRDLSSPAFDLYAGSPLWSPDGRQIRFTTGDQVWQDVFSYDLAGGQYRKITHQQEIRLDYHSFSRDGSRVAFFSETSTEPGDIYVAGSDFAAPRRLTRVNPQAADFALGATTVLHWKSSDGWPVEGLLLKPVGYQPGHRYPLLVNVHGGPTGAFANGFAAYNQFWAGKGWAVLLVNPRGSTGYGEKFLRGNINDWGGGDYRDIMTGVDAAIAAGVADPDKMGEWGWSYGGYMTCWIVSQTGRFKAAMMGAGLSDLVSMYGTTDIPNYLGGFLGGYPDAATRKLYRERSGLTYADHVTSPLLILQGAEDERVPTSQSLEFFRALKDRGKTVRLFFYPREHHGFVEYYHLLDRYQRIYDWISHYTLGTEPVLPAERN
jgi:dipeptidyl aminopeptidase/acylaminoacyl peptidase